MRVRVVLRLESPTRTLTLEAPRGVEVNAGVGDFTAYCRKDLLLQSSEGEVSVFFHGVCVCVVMWGFLRETDKNDKTKS